MSSIKYPQKKISENFISVVGGKLNGDAARTFFMRSGLQQQILGRIWVLSDNDKDGQLSSNEFNVAMKLVRMARQVCFILKSEPL